MVSLSASLLAVSTYIIRAATVWHRITVADPEVQRVIASVAERATSRDVPEVKTLAYNTVPAEVVE